MEQRERCSTTSSKEASFTDDVFCCFSVLLGHIVFYSVKIAHRRQRREQWEFRQQLICP